jgi:hypothetical protein
LVGIPFHCLARHTLPLTSQRTASRPSLRRAALSSGDTSEPATPPIHRVASPSRPSAGELLARGSLPCR